MIPEREGPFMREHSGQVVAARFMGVPGEGRVRAKAGGHDVIASSSTETRGRKGSVWRSCQPLGGQRPTPFPIPSLQFPTPSLQSEAPRHRTPSTSQLAENSAVFTNTNQRLQIEVSQATSTSPRGQCSDKSI